ncbi:hypothetical protein BJY52DRAFT_1417004 [Lactarius psammicola]|nr:hypothetical protein BJY52DRAFT_1417004 [Lactarius psammicola]
MQLLREHQSGELKEMKRKMESVMSGAVSRNFDPATAAAEETPSAEVAALTDRAKRTTFRCIAEPRPAQMHWQDALAPREVRVMMSYRPRLRWVGTAAARIRSDMFGMLAQTGLWTDTEGGPIGEREVFWDGIVVRLGQYYHHSPRVPLSEFCLFILDRNGHLLTREPRYIVSYKNVGVTGAQAGAHPGITVRYFKPDTRLLHLPVWPSPPHGPTTWTVTTLCRPTSFQNPEVHRNRVLAYCAMSSYHLFCFHLLAYQKLGFKLKRLSERVHPCMLFLKTAFFPAPGAYQCLRWGHVASFSEPTPTTPKMVNWQDPILILRDALALIKLLHAAAGLYIWETVFTAGFELSILRGKRPYRWTIWLYLGTRYTCLLMFIVFFINNDGGGQVSCQPLIIADFALAYACWAFASLIIVLRVQVLTVQHGDTKVLNVARFRIAIWNRNTIVSAIVLSMWLAGLGIEATYDSVVGACIVLKTHSGLASAATSMAVDTMLLVAMLIGLLRHAHRSSTGIWNLLYKQCIIWMILAAIAEIPPVVFLILNLNDVWNEMFPVIGITILSICATRMYRSLSKHGSLTEYSSDPPQFSARLPLSNYPHGEAHGVHSTIHFTTVTQSDRTMAEPSVFVPAGQIELEPIPGASNSTLAVPAKTKPKDMPGYQISWLRTG